MKRIDHLGIVAGTIKDLGIADIVNESIGSDSQEKITGGEIVAGMILNGLGFISRPLMLTPQFFENKALDVLVNKGIQPEHFNRHKIGRVLDDIGQYGAEKLFNTIALTACIKEEVDMTFGHSDTTSYSLSGEYDPDSDTQKIHINHGHSKDKRPDLKQIVQELVVSQDGGIPWVTKTWSGNTSDTVILRERAINLMKEFAKSGSRIFVGDSKLYNSKTAPTLNKINFITRVPSSLDLEQEVIAQSLQMPESWNTINEDYKFQERSVDLYDIEDQRWVIVYSQKARNRSKKTIDKAIKKESKKIQKELFHLMAQRFACESDAQKELKSVHKKWKFHKILEEKITMHKRYAKRGRPVSTTPEKHEWQIEAKATIDEKRVAILLNQNSCFVLGTNVLPKTLSAQAILTGYKGQDKVEKGFAFLKSPNFFASSLFLKKPARIESLLVIMVLSLLVYSIAQRRLRKQLALLKSTLPNQINQPTSTPTMRWIFQLFEGVDHVTVVVENSVRVIVNGITDIRKKIIELLSPNIQEIYQISSTGG